MGCSYWFAQLGLVLLAIFGISFAALIVAMTIGVWRMMAKEWR